MATSLLRQGGYGGGLAEILAAFLSADFDRLLAITAEFWRDHPELTGREGSAALLAAPADDLETDVPPEEGPEALFGPGDKDGHAPEDRKSTRLNSSH